MGSRRAKSIPVDSVAWDPRPKRLPENPTSHLPSWYNHDEVMVSMLESGVDFNAVCRAVLQQHATILSSSGAGTAGGEEKDADAETTTTSTSFSSTAPGVEKLTARMLQNRWYQFLYDPTADRQHLGNLCGGTTLTKRGGGVAWSDFEEHVLLNKRGQYKSFTELLHHHPTDFHPSRTPRSLEAHFAQLTEVISSLTAQQHQQQQNGATAGGPDNHNDNNSDNHNDNNAATSTATNTSIAAAAAKTPTLTPTTPTATTHTNGDEIAVKSPPAKRQRTSKAASSSSAAAATTTAATTAAKSRKGKGKANTDGDAMMTTLDSHVTSGPSTPPPTTVTTATDQKQKTPTKSPAKKPATKSSKAKTATKGTAKSKSKAQTQSPTTSLPSPHNHTTITTTSSSAAANSHSNNRRASSTAAAPAATISPMLTSSSSCSSLSSLVSNSLSSPLATATAESPSQLPFAPAPFSLSFPLEAQQQQNHSQSSATKNSFFPVAAPDPSSASSPSSLPIISLSFSSMDDVNQVSTVSPVLPVSSASLSRAKREAEGGGEQLGVTHSVKGVDDSKEKGSSRTASFREKLETVPTGAIPFHGLNEEHVMKLRNIMKLCPLVQEDKAWAVVTSEHPHLRFVCATPKIAICLSPSGIYVTSDAPPQGAIPLAELGYRTQSPQPIYVRSLDPAQPVSLLDHSTAAATLTYTPLTHPTTFDSSISLLVGSSCVVHVQRVYRCDLDGPSESESNSNGNNGIHLRSIVTAITNDSEVWTKIQEISSQSSLPHSQSMSPDSSQSSASSMSN